jgi:hypothetical protein
MESSFESLCCKLSAPFNLLDATGRPLASLLTPPGKAVCPYDFMATIESTRRMEKQKRKNMLDWNFKSNPKGLIGTECRPKFLCLRFKKYDKN